MSCSTVLTMSERLGGDSAVERRERGSPMSSSFTFKMMAPRGARWREGKPYSLGRQEFQVLNSKKSSMISPANQESCTLGFQSSRMLLSLDGNSSPLIRDLPFLWEKIVIVGGNKETNIYTLQFKICAEVRPPLRWLQLVLDVHVRRRDW